MTPTLYGRWQTRLFLLGTLGVILTALFGLIFQDFQTPFVLLGYVFLSGCGWDLLYRFLQTLRWNHDWPPAFAFVAGLWEGVFILLLVRLFGLPGVSSSLTKGQFIAHYGSVFLVTFAASLGLMHILFPRWRFNGGQLW